MRHHSVWVFLLLSLTAHAARAEPRPRLPVLPNDDAWRRLPGAPETAQLLPAWARMLAGPMPLTTARMLELDALHRSGDRLDARLRALVRWAAADANGCDYGKTMAAADFARAGGQEKDLAALVKTPDRLPQADRLAVAFARRMMLEAHAVTDAEVKQLIDLLGEERVVALVALLAHASFQDRIFLALNAREDGRGIPPPVTVRFGRTQPKNTASQPVTSKSAYRPTEEEGGLATGIRWLVLEDKREKQKLRPGRIRVPSREEVVRRLGENHPGAWQSGIVWSRVCYGYQPELTDAWFDCANAFRQETDLDRVFSNEIFWVVTESLQCFY
jgi:alkylhydroperoxidase family enzyme